MILRRCLAACLVLLLATVEDSSAQATGPIIMSQSKTLVVNVGSSVILECRVANLGSKQISWTFLTTKTTIYFGGVLMTDNPTKFSIIRPSDSSAYNLQIVEVEKSDQGFFKCKIDGTDQSVTVHLDVIEKLNHPTIPNLSPLNRTECCLAQNISQECVGACSPSTLSLTSLSSVAQCVDNHADGLVRLVHCLTAGSNHEHCCLFKNLDPLCLSFCRNEVPEDLGSAHEKCLTPQPLFILVTCATQGFATLPSEPQEVSVIPHNDGASSYIQVSWKPPLRNADKVTGYKIMYRRSGTQKYFSVIKKNPLSNYASLSNSNIVANMGYDVHVAAIAEHGASGASVEVSIFMPDYLLNDRQNKDIDDCCEDRQVSDKCRASLCDAKTWSQLDVSSLSQCFNKLEDVFTCLAGERDHTRCCTAFGVSSECAPLCSGKPPPLNSSLIACVQQMAIIEACVQQGYGSLPVPPSNLLLERVTSHGASLKFQTSLSIFVVRYVVLLKVGEGRDAMFTQWGFLNPGDQALILNKLAANTVYAVRLTSETDKYGSLPSETVHFLTYPENFGEPTIPPVINIPHNFSECCYSKGMPDICAEGCKYVQDISSYFKDNLFLCYSHIGTVLSCAADGRDHEACCIRSKVTDPDCLDLCGLAEDGPLNDDYIKCLQDTPKAIACFQSGLTELPRYPNAFVSNVSQNTISLQWIHPPTSTLIETYIVQYRASDQSKFIEERTNQTHLILHNLLAVTEYEITVRSQNENGTSSPSPLIRQYTLEDNSEKPDFHQTEVSGRQYWQNITECCHSSGISEECIDQCLNKQSDSMGDNCVLQSHKMLACYAEGQDHGECCRENPDLPAICVAICRGHAMNLTLDMTVCMGHGHRDIILSCYLQNSDLIPSAPLNVVVKLKDTSTVEVSWLKPKAYCGSDCVMEVHYWREDRGDQKDPGARNVMVESRVTSPYTTGELLDGFYTFTVIARNTYGSSPPSSLETLYVSSYNKDVEVILQGNNRYVEKGNTAVLRCITTGFNPFDPFRIKWLYNGRRQLSSTSHILVLNNVDPIKDEGTYSCQVKDSAVEVTDSLFLPIRYAPKFFDNRGDQVLPGNGRTVVLACSFYGFPTTGPDHWKKDNKDVRVSIPKYSSKVVPDYEKGITEYKLTIYNVVTSDYGHYSISVSNSFGSASCKVATRNPMDLTIIAPAKKVSDPKACCAAEGVTELCQELCSFKIDVAEIVADPKYITCLSYFNSLIKCGADGKDHGKCCKDKGVNPYCFPFCAGKSPGSHITEQDALLKCVSDSAEIFSCIEEGQKLVPYPPKNVMVKWWASNSEIQVRWSRPQFNHDLVQSYIVYYKSTSHPQEIHVGVNKHVQEYVITDPKFNDQYEVYVLSSNTNGQSQKSNVATIKPLTLSPPTGLKVQVSGTTVVISWTPPADVDPNVQYVLNYKEMNSVRYEKTANIKGTSYTLESLEAVSPYIAFVTSISAQSHQSSPSTHVTFTTGQVTTTTERSGPGTKSKQGGSDNNDEIAIGVGVVVAIIALVIIGVVIFVIIKGREGFKSSHDTVAFENPIAGGSGGVKIHGMGGNNEQFDYGRLEEDNAYDNTSTPAAAGVDGAYENPAYAGQEITEASGGAATLDLNSDV